MIRLVQHLPQWTEPLVLISVLGLILTKFWR
jgi:hypothetical protein